MGTNFFIYLDSGLKKHIGKSSDYYYFCNQCKRQRAINFCSVCNKSLGISFTFMWGIPESEINQLVHEIIVDDQDFEYTYLEFKEILKFCSHHNFGLVGISFY